MARRSGFRSVHGGRSQRRQTQWLSLTPALTSIDGADTAVLISSLTTAEKALRPFTIVRTRGWLEYRSNQEAASESYGGAYGLTVVSEQAIAIGVTAVPTPITDMDSDLWFVYESMGGRYVLHTAVGAEETGSGRLFDSKAMRKVEEGQDVAVTMETTTPGISLACTNGFRMLIKLH